MTPMKNNMCDRPFVRSIFTRNAKTAAETRHCMRAQVNGDVVIHTSIINDCHTALDSSLVHVANALM